MEITSKPTPKPQAKPLSPFARAVLRWRRALEMSHLPPALKLAALVLLIEFASRNRFPKTGRLEFWPTQESLAVVLGRNARSIREALSGLADEGVIRLLRRGGREQGSSEYALRPEWRDDVEAKLYAAGTLGEHPLSALIAGQAGEIVRKTSSGRNRPLEEDQSVRLRRTKSSSNLTESPNLNHLARETPARSGYSSSPPRKNGVLVRVRSPLAEKRDSAKAALEQYQPSPEFSVWLDEHYKGRTPLADCFARWKSTRLGHGRIPEDPQEDFRAWAIDQPNHEGRGSTFRGAPHEGRAVRAMNRRLDNIGKGN